MVRNYRVTVAGESYEVVVEELGPGPAAVKAVERVQPQAAKAAPGESPVVPPAPAPRQPAGGGSVTSPLPGKVLSVRAQVGQKVKRGDLLLVIEAMKMENEIFAAAAGTVRKVHVTAGQNVETGDLLAEFSPGD
jgi:glutaconyl-CoA decarboxylase